MKFASVLFISVLSASSAFASDATTVGNKQELSANDLQQLSGSYPNAVPRPDLAGMRVISYPSGAVSVVNPEGMLQHIPNSGTYNKLFKNWDNLVRMDISTIYVSFPLSGDAALIKGATADVYLLSNGMKRPITEAAMGKYNFEWRNIETYPQYMLDSIPTGRLWQ